MTSEARVAGIRFQRAGKVYYFDPMGIDMDINDQVVVEVEHGNKIGKVVIAPQQVMSSELKEPLKPVLRKASPEDFEQEDKGREKEKEAIAKCKELAHKHELPIKILDAESDLDMGYITIFFSAEGRVDFRQMVRELASAMKVRVELRQVGPRDEAKFVGGVGRCGYQLCCTAFLTEFSPLSIKIAKEQNLSLNPAKISGNCGRLLCCLGYEADFYRQMKEKLPSVGQRVQTSMGDANVVGVNQLKETVTVQLESMATVEFPVAEIGPAKKRQPRERRGKRESKPNPNHNDNPNSNANDKPKPNSRSKPRSKPNPKSNPPE